MQNSGSNTDVTSTLSSESNQQGRLGAVAPKKSIETIIQRTDSKSKRSEGGLEDGDQQSICSASESSESLLLSIKKKDRGVSLDLLILRAFGSSNLVAWYD